MKRGCIAVGMAMSALMSWPLSAQQQPPPQQQDQPPGTNQVALVRVVPVVWPREGMLSERGIAELREERRIFANELRKLKQWVPGNMRGAVVKQWTKGKKNVISESHAIEHVPEMPAVEVEKIICEMDEGARDSVPDNQERFRTAIGKRVPMFANAMALYKDGKWAEAAKAVEPLTDENILHCFQGRRYDTLPPYTYCLVVGFEAEAFGMAGAAHDAMIRYGIIGAKLCNSVTYSPTARIRFADLYERTQKGPHFAIPLYQSVLERFSGTLTDTEALRLQVRTRNLMNVDPFRRVVAAAGEARRLQDRGHSGPMVQELLDRLVGWMKDSVIDPEHDVRMYMQSNQTMVGGEGGWGALEKGPAPERFEFRGDVAVTGSDDWGGLRPREKQEMIQQFYATYPDEYREMLEAYFSNMSREENKQQVAPGQGGRDGALRAE